jgi:MFS family permease
MIGGIRQLDEQCTLTNRQKVILVVASIHGMLEFFDQFIIAFVLIFVMKPWRLTYGESAIVLLSSGIGSIIGAIVWGYIADQFGRRPTLVAIIMTYSLSSLLLALTPAGNWVYFAMFRTGVGLGVGRYIVISHSSRSSRRLGSEDGRAESSRFAPRQACCSAPLAPHISLRSSAGGVSLCWERFQRSSRSSFSPTFPNRRAGH